MKRLIIISLLALLQFPLSICGKTITIRMERYGMSAADSTQNAAVAFQQAMSRIRKLANGNDKIVVSMPKGRYHFYPQGAAEREYYVSNHDQPNPKHVGICMEGMKNVTLDGNGSDFIFHGQMMPLSLVKSSQCVLKNFSIDFDNPHIAQAKVVSNDTVSGTIIYEMAPWVKYKVEDGTLYTFGDGWKYQPNMCIAFEPGTRHIVFNTSDTPVKSSGITELPGRQIKADGWKNPKLIPGTVMVLRTWNRPAPGMFLSDDLNTRLENVKMHYAEGMGLLAQMCENITLNHFCVCLRGEKDPRYFSTQADATHFSGCKGLILSENGLYENMMDDAINVHGTYLKLVEKIDDHTVKARYMHNQSYGFRWGEVGDSVQFIASRTMEIVGNPNTIKSIHAADKPINKGVKEFWITFSRPLESIVAPETSIGIENLTWTPKVVFRNNIVRNNRARGALFSTPRHIVAENNFFDHTSGTAILLCGDCNGWYETGACHDITIRGNHFKNGLTNMFQFTNAIISIYPEIPDLKNQKKYFHSGIVIENNVFETFDNPLLYAKSVDGLIFRNNILKINHEYPAFHWNKQRFLLERVINSKIEEPTEK